LFFNIFLRLLLSFAQCILQKVLSPPMLRGLLFEDVAQKIFVSLYQLI
jgi:hypothetical protein